MNQDELFLPFVEHGDACGIAGVEPQYRRELMTLLRNWDYKTIAAWLRSANTEKQLYAMEGLKILAVNGVEIKREDQTLINLLKKKKGMVRTCGGCSYELESTKAVAQQIDSLKTNMRLPRVKNWNKTALYVGFIAVLLLIIIAKLYYKKRKESEQGRF